MMMPIRSFADRHGKARRIAFRTAIVVTSLFLLMVLLPAYRLLVTNWLPRDAWLAVRTDRAAGEEVHRLHSLALAMLAWGMLLGVVLQLHRPDRKASALLASLAVPVAISASEALAGTFTVAGMAPFFLPILLVIALHPAAGEFVRLPGWNLPMLGLGIAVALPWVMYAFHQAEAAHGAEPAWEVDHMTFASAMALLAVLWAVIGASHRAGWQYAAGASLAATACVGLQSVIFTDVLSGLSLPWAAAALVWCLAYGSAAILRTTHDESVRGGLVGSLERPQASR